MGLPLLSMKLKPFWHQGKEDQMFCILYRVKSSQQGVYGAVAKQQEIYILS